MGEVANVKNNIQLKTQEIKDKLQRHRQEKLECRAEAVLKLGVRCHAEAPGYLIFYCLILALWILSDCPLKTF